MITYVDVERLVREVYRLPIDEKLAAALSREELLALAVKIGERVSQVEYDSALVDVVAPETEMHDKYMREEEFWDNE